MAEWNIKLAAYVKDHFGNAADAALTWGIPGQTLRDYASGRITDINKMKPARRAVLYKNTGIEELKPEGYEQLLAGLDAPTPPAPAYPAALERRRRLVMEGADIAVELFYAFAKQLGEICSDEEALRFLAEALHPKDVGLVDAYLNALSVPPDTARRFVFGQPSVLRGRRK